MGEQRREERRRREEKRGETVSRFIANRLLDYQHQLVMMEAANCVA